MELPDPVDGHVRPLGPGAVASVNVPASPTGPPMTTNETEARTRLIGREIFARLDRHGPVLLTPSWWDDKLMGLGMHDPALKVQLFRFVDTLPYLRTGTEVSRHLREYLAEAYGDLPGW